MTYQRSTILDQFPTWDDLADVTWAEWELWWTNTSIQSRADGWLTWDSLVDLTWDGWEDWGDEHFHPNLTFVSTLAYLLIAIASGLRRIITVARPQRIITRCVKTSIDCC